MKTNEIIMNAPATEEQKDYIKRLIEEKEKREDIDHYYTIVSPLVEMFESDFHEARMSLLTLQEIMKVIEKSNLVSLVSEPRKGDVIKTLNRLMMVLDAITAYNNPNAKLAFDSWKMVFGGKEVKVSDILELQREYIPKQPLFDYCPLDAFYDKPLSELKGNARKQRIAEMREAYRLWYGGDDATPEEVEILHPLPIPNNDSITSNAKK